MCDFTQKLQHALNEPNDKIKINFSCIKKALQKNCFCFVQKVFIKLTVFLFISGISIIVVMLISFLIASVCFLCSVRARVFFFAYFLCLSLHEYSVCVYVLCVFFSFEN